MALATRTYRLRIPIPEPALHWPRWPAAVQDRGGRAALDPLRRGRPRPPPLHARPRTGRRDRQGRRARRSRASARGSSRSATSSWCSTRAAASCRRSPASQLVRSHDASREDAVPAGGRLDRRSRRCCGSSPSRRRTSRAFHALARFLDLLDELEAARRRGRALDPLVLSFQLKLLWLSGYLPHLDELRGVRGGGSARRVLAAGRRRRVRGVRGGAIPLSPRGRLEAIRGLLEPRRSPRRPGPGDLRARPPATRCGVDRAASYEYHGGFRLRTDGRSVRRDRPG